MSTRTFVMVVALAVAPVAKGEVLVELVPDRPGPYVGGESLTVDVWLHSEVSFDGYIWLVRLDFSDSDGQLGLDPTFTFNLSSSGSPEDFEVHPELPIPWTANWKEYACPFCRLQLPAGGSLHIGSIGVNLPNEPGTYRLGVLNADDPDENHGAWVFEGGSRSWRAFTGEITGGVYDFVVVPPLIPAVSEWGLIVMTLLLLVLGSVTIMPRTRSAKDTSSSRQEGRSGDSVSPALLHACASLIALICAGGVLLGSSNDAKAQAPLLPVETIQVGVDSGIVSPTGTGNDPVVVFSRVVQVKGPPGSASGLAKFDSAVHLRTATNPL